MEKLNYVWSKAVHHLQDTGRSDKLMKELETFDKLYLHAKQQGHHGKSKDEMSEIDRKLELLLDRFDLPKALEAFKRKFKSANEHVHNTESDNDVVLRSEAFEDARLEKLWKAAKDADFSAAQLTVLYRDLKDHEHQLGEYEELLRDHDHEEKNDIHGEEHSEKARKLKETNTQLEDNLEHLHNKIVKLKETPFENRKVQHLWNTALSNRQFRPEELDAIRTELKHFEKQLAKLDFHKEEMGTARELHAGSKNGLSGDVLDDFEERQARMERKLKKLETYLNEKVRHSEL
uniref:Alpha-2-MRAP_C domain-containing protein n=1 Tax=Steinernema glaseri TaxID=37863 RepID=A0A1I7YV38_9BILA